MATNAGTVSTPGTSAALPKKKGVVRKIIFYTAAATGTFYVGSVFVAFNEPRYYDFFNQNVPLGQPVLAYAERNDWDEITTDSFLHKGIEIVGDVSQFVSRQLGGTSQSAAEKEKEKMDEKVAATKAVVAEKYAQSKDRIKSVTSALTTKVGKSQEKVVDGTKRGVEGTKKVAAITRDQLSQFSEGVEELVRKAEAALADTASQVQAAVAPQPSTTDSVPAPVAVAPQVANTSDKVYDAQLPLGHELPYGFSRPAPPKPSPAPPVDAAAASAPLPLVAPTVAGLGISEPVISQLAATIDSLASYLNSNPTAAEKAKDVLETAKLDLTGLASRIEAIKGEEREQLEKTLDDQAKEYTAKLLELEMQAQDKLDSQEDDFRKFYDHERMKFVQAYREKLNHELQTQTELINER